jgi:hypothetical protein
MGVMQYKIQRFAFESGERYALLINANTGLPLMYQNLYVTIHIRNTGESINTMIACLSDLRLLEEICHYLDIQLEQRFAKGEVLLKSEIESISYWTKKTKVALESAQKIKETENAVLLGPKFKRLESSRHTVAIDADLVNVMTTYNRLSNIISYVAWLARTVAPEHASNKIDKMEVHFRTYRPKKQYANNNDTNVFKSLTESQMIRVLDVIRPDSEDNPWKDSATRHRNQMIVNLLYDVGCRKGEL